MSINKLSLDQPAYYEITVPGKLDRESLDWDGGLEVIKKPHQTGVPTTTIAITADQAGVQGLLRYLYSLGLPLISVVCQDALKSDLDQEKP